MAKLRMAHASTHGARKPPGPKVYPAPKYKLLQKVALINVLTLPIIQKQFSPKT